MSDFESRRLAELKRIADASEVVSASTPEVLAALSKIARDEAAITAAEVAATTGAAARINANAKWIRVTLRTAAGLLGWVWFTAGVIDYHIHGHLDIEQVPLSPVTPFPLGRVYSVITVALVIGLVWASFRVNGESEQHPR